MKKYKVYGEITSSKFIGEIEANSIEEAIKKAWDHHNSEVDLCYHCSKDLSEVEITEMFVDGIIEPDTNENNEE